MPRSIFPLVVLWFGLVMVATPARFIELVNDLTAGLQRLRVDTRIDNRLPEPVPMQWTRRRGLAIRGAGMTLILLSILELYGFAQWVLRR